MEGKSVVKTDKIVPIDTTCGQLLRKEEQKEVKITVFTAIEARRIQHEAKISASKKV